MHLQVGNVIKFHQDWNGVQFAKNASCIRKFCALFHMGVSLHNALCTPSWKDLDMPVKYSNRGSSHTLGSLPFQGEGCPWPSNIQSPNKTVLYTHYTSTVYKLHQQLLPTHNFWNTDHYSAIVHPQTKKSRPGAKIIAVLRPFCFQQSIKPTTSFFNNGKAKWISPGKDHLLRISPYFFHWDSISRDSVENLSLRFYA